jgi:hypothetical protein
MKYLKYYKLFENHYTDKILYHGGLHGYYDEETGKNMFNKFTKFHNQLSFFSDNPKFAIDYANTKSMDGGYDADRILYKCKFTGTLFEPWNKEDIDKLIKELPEETTIHHPSHSYMTTNIYKQTLIDGIQGFKTVYPLDNIENLKIGEIIKNNYYDYIIIKKDKDWVYAVSKENYDRTLNASSRGYSEHFKSEIRYKKIFEIWRNAIVDLWNKKMNDNVKYQKSSYSTTHDLQIVMYSYVEVSKNPGVPTKSYMIDKNFIVSKQEVFKIDQLWKEAVENFNRIYYKEAKITKFNLKPIKVSIKEGLYGNFIYFENNVVANAIHKLGYDGYIAYEEGNKTYAIYEPDKTVKIINTQVN